MTKGMPAGFISEAAMADRLGKGVPTLRRWGAAGYGPKRFKVGKSIIYRADGDLRWLEGVEQEQPRELPQPRRRGRQVSQAQVPDAPKMVQVAPFL